jgi:peptidyl-tRNA hydrolase
MAKLSEIRLIILMRTDLASLNPGKAIAQGSHAAHAAVFHAKASKDENLHDMVKEWEHQSSDKSFGTCIVLGVKEFQMRQAVDIALELGIHAGIVRDDTYPLQDGETLHLIPLDTCAYIFGRKDDTALATQGLELYP